MQNNWISHFSNIYLKYFKVQCRLLNIYDLTNCLSLPVCLSVGLSVWFCQPVSQCLYVPLSLCALCIYVSVWICSPVTLVCDFVSLCLCVSVIAYMPIYIYIGLSVSFCFYLFLCPSVPLCICASVPLCPVPLSLYLLIFFISSLHLSFNLYLSFYLLIFYLFSPFVF